MKLQSKITYFFLISSTVLVIIIALVGLATFRYFSFNTAKEHSLAIAESIRVSLTESMIHGTISKRKSYLDRISQVEGLLSTRVVRGTHIINQHGAGLAIENKKDSIDEQVLKTGIATYVLENEDSNPVIRSTIPYIATDKGTINCLTCHKVANGSVLGAITIRTSIANLKNGAIATIGTISAVLAFFALIALFFFRKLVKPLLTTANDLQLSVEHSKKGSFDIHIKKRTNDEIGQIATDFNDLITYLDEGLKHINKSVAQLINCKFNSGTDTLANTINMVESLADASRFKQSIEEDETKEEVYQRLGYVLGDHFSIKHFTIYEVCSTKKNQMIPVIVDGVSDDTCHWCNPQILIRPEACRAKRTGHIIDSNETANICNYFTGDDEHDHYICVPIIQAGSVGSVIQIVSNKDDSKTFQKIVPFIQPYLREASPVIETKRLMSTLKESNLRDAMTGLNNRRFLEEYVETMVAGVERNKTTLSILMLDLDYFKKVNDSFGHDVGDKVLIALAKVLKNAVRSSDMVIRYGGEEFLIILQNTVPDYGDTIAEKIRVAVEAMKVDVGGQVLQKTISIGVSSFPEDSDTFWQAIKYADVALYQAKEQGRNRALHFTKEMWKNEAGEY